MTSNAQSANHALDSWLTPSRFALVLGALLLAALPQVLLGLETFVVRDYGFFAYPLAHYQKECFLRGELPLWNPYSNCGVPFMAQWNTMPLYPPALLYLLLPLNWSLSFFCLLHLFWAGLGMYFLAHHWTSNRLSASVAGLSFAFNGLSLNLLMWPSHIATLSWMPWVVLALERAWSEGGRRVFLAALVGALQMLAGGPETILFTWLLAAAVWVVQSPAFPGRARPSRRAAVGWLWRFPAVTVLVAGLAAAQLFPFLDLVVHSQREQGYADTRWSMPGWGWMNFFVPMVFGTAGKQNLFFQYGQYWTSSYYLGGGAVLLALLAVWRVCDRRVLLLAGASALALLLAFGDETLPSHWLRRAVPQLSLITYPVKFVTVLVFTVPLLAAFGLSRLRAFDDERKHTEKRLVFIAGALLVLIAGILFWAVRFPFPSDNVAATLRNGLYRAGFLGLVAALLLVFQRARPPMWRVPLGPALGPLLLLLVLWLDVWTHEPPQNPTVKPGIYALNLAREELKMNPQPALGQSRAMVSPAAEMKFMQLVLNDPEKNFLAKRLGYFANCNLLDHVPKVNGFFSLSPRECGELNSAIYISGNACPAGLADFMSVSQLTAPDQYVKWLPRSSFLPEVTTGQQPVFLDDTNALGALLRPEFDSRAQVILQPEVRDLLTVTKQTHATILSQQFAPQRVDIAVEAAEPSLVVVAQTYYHCWRAYLDGAPTRLLRANYAFQAVQVPAGNHALKLVYEDRAFYRGAMLSGLCLLVCLAGLAKPKSEIQNPKEGRSPKTEPATTDRQR
jgi:hypothetical protein